MCWRNSLFLVAELNGLAEEELGVESGRDASDLPHTADSEMGTKKNSLPMYPTTRWHTLTPPHSLWLHASSLKDEENFRLLLREEMPERIRGGWVEWGVVRHKYTQQMELRFGGK